ncbi:MAG: hypothetical protein V8Q79_06835 [Christensenellales bacterium]
MSDTPAGKRKICQSCRQGWKPRSSKSTRSQFLAVKKLMNDKETGDIICATDAGREGELIFRYIYEQAGCSKPVQTSVDFVHDGRSDPRGLLQPSSVVGIRCPV